MIRAAQTEIRRLYRLHQSTELQLMLLTERSVLNAHEEAKVIDLKQRQRQLLERIAWFEAILHEHEEPSDAAAE